MSDQQARLMDAVYGGRRNEAVQLVSEGLDLDAPLFDHRRLTPLMAAVEQERLDAVRLLVEIGADINAADFHGNTPLHQAVDISIDGTIQAGREPGEEPLEIIVWLIDHGAQVDRANERGMTPIDLATRYKSRRVVAALRDRLSGEGG